MIKAAKNLLKFALCIVVLIAAYIGINEGMAAFVHYKIEEKYLSTSADYIYVSDRENEREIIKAIESAMDRFPTKLVKEFKSSWLVVVSPAPPEELMQVQLASLSRSSGLNLTTAKTVWISSDMSYMHEEIFAHEFGHFIAYESAGIDYSKRFKELYESNKDTYIQKGEDKVIEYDSSTSNEFFAMMCKEYVLYPDYFREHFREGYDYISELFGKNPYPFFLSKYGSEFISGLYNVYTQIKENLKVIKDVG